ncbi:MAG: hypothetical protein JSS76_12310 [Bacteroidetes bacterium]|nr:hypothetical protein [Bacteroidota bacterium]
MNAIKTDIYDKYIELDTSRLPESPFCRDIYHYHISEPHRVVLRYTLRLYGDYREIVGEYVCEAVLTSTTVITSLATDHFMADLAYTGRDKFNQEALRRGNLRLFLPRLSTMQIEGLDAA